MFENFTDRARRVISYAVKEAQQVGADFVGTEHLLLGLYKEPTGLAAHALRECKADEAATRAALFALGIKLVPVDPPPTPSPLPFNPYAKKALEESIAEARRFGHPYIGTEHILLGLLKDPESSIALVLTALKVAPQAIVVVLYDLLGFDPSAYPEAKKVEAPTPAAVMLNAARAESSKTLKEPKNRAYLTAVVLVQRLKEAGMTWDETVGLAVVLRQMTEAEANKLMYRALMGDVGEQGAKPQ